ncbi:MAG: hypothetical protein AB1941_14280 [Gemmatimonadota bacterium]
MTIARRWRVDATARITGLVWAGYDRLRSGLLSQLDRHQDDYILEESITEELEREISDVMTRLEPFVVQHGAHEWLSQLPGTTKAPIYDIAFVLRDYRASKWPIEAKVLRTDGTVSEYVHDLQEQFLKCRYAPCSTEGAMLGYLLSGTPSVAFDNIGRSAGCTLDAFPEAPGRDHRTSQHVRSVPQGKSSPPEFCCHHMLMPM